MPHSTKPSKQPVKPTIGLVLEGTYPFVKGGVSSWLHRLMIGLSDRYHFKLFFLGSDPADYTEPVYDMPECVLSLDCFYLYEPSGVSKSIKVPSQAELFTVLFHEFLANKKPLLLECFPLILSMIKTNGMDLVSAYMKSHVFWHGMVAFYEESYSNESFNHFVWNYKVLFKQFYIMLDVSNQLGESDAYHAISTGYAGGIAALAALRFNKPIYVTEHGIYTKERNLDLQQVAWSNQSKINFYDQLPDSKLLGLWIQFFTQLGQMAYDQAYAISSLYQGNLDAQKRLGAAPDQLRIIRNGIDVSRFTFLNPNRPIPPCIALIGRVVPIKDVKYFIRSVYLLKQKRSDIKALVVGPSDESPDYRDQCLALVKLLDLESVLTFTGPQDVKEVMKSLGLVVLTSISEAQPLVLLEAMATGVPVVATDVGACREIIEGGSDENPSLGSCGTVVPIANPEVMANAMMHLLSDAQAWRLASQVGKQRIDLFYTEKLMNDSYAALYDQGMVIDA